MPINFQCLTLTRKSGPNGCTALCHLPSTGRFPDLPDPDYAGHYRELDAYELIARVTDWSQRDHRVTAAGVCGSYARGEETPDSDVDFCILTGNPRSLLDDRSWIRGLGADARGDGPVEDYNLVQSIRVFYGSTEAEFGITDEAWAQLPIDRETASVINDGLHVLYDPHNHLAAAVAAAAKILR